MPPKKDDKKGKKGGGTALKEVDPALYVRKPVVLPEIKDVLVNANSGKFTGLVANVEQLFPEWSIEGEAWTEPIAPEALKEITYPKNLNIASTTTISTLFDLNAVEVVDPKAKAPKKEVKKGKNDVEPEMTEQFTNEAGKTLPVMIRDPDSTEYKGTIFPRDFYKYYTIEQLKLKNEQDALKTHIEELRQKVAAPTTSTEPTAEQVHDKEHALKQIAKLEETLRKSQAIVNMDTDPPSGVEIDPFITAAYREVLRFAPPIITHHHHHEGISTEADGSIITELNTNFLWRAIYPQLPNGKPIYNADGKYCVKLFLAGKWRKIYVDDQIPLREDGRPAIAHISDEMELWPMILAKAIYTVHSACGYSKHFDDVTEGDSLPVTDLTTVTRSDADLTTSAPGHKISQFVSFSVHLLTAWQPSVPLPMQNTFLFEKPKANMFIQSILSAGCYNIPTEDIVCDDNVTQDKNKFHSYANDVTIRTALRLGDGHSDNAEGDLSPGGSGVLKTKKQFEAEYIARKNTRDEIIRNILDREKKIDKLTEVLATTPRTDTSFISVYNSETRETQVLPVLALNFPSDSSNLLDIKVLVDWRTAPQVEIPETVVSYQGVFNPSILKGRDDRGGVVMRRDEETPLPHSTPLVYRWVSVEELVRQNAHIVSMNTNLQVPFTAHFSRHWAPLPPVVVEAPTGKGGKEKASPTKKDKNAPVVTVSPEDTICGDEGMAPITMLVLDTASLYVEPESVTGTAIAASGTLTGTEQPLLSAEEAEALAAQTQELDNVNHQPDSRPVSASQQQTQETQAKTEDFVYLSVLIHADLVTAPASKATADSSGDNAENDLTEPLHPQQGKVGVPSDTVLVLQEYRTDNVDPLMYIIDLKDKCYLPYNKQMFGIPKSRLPENHSEPLIFWLRLYTKSSVYIQFNSNVKVTCDTAENIWTALNRPFYACEGDSSVTREETEQLLFRMPLVSEPSNGVTATANAGDAKENDKPTAVLSTITSPCVTFLHISDREIERNVSLKLLNNRTDDDTTYTTLDNTQCNLVELNSDAKRCNTLIGTVYPKASDTSIVPPFHWKLLLLGVPAVPIVTPERPINEVAVTQRYNGSYVANSKLALFRDVFTVEKASFPIALRLTLSPIGTTATASGSDSSWSDSSANSASDPATAFIDDIYVSLRMYRKSDLTLVSTFRGRRVCRAYSQSIDLLLNPGEEATTAVTVGKKDAKAAPPVKGRGAPVAETIDLIVECVLDESHPDMVIPPQFKSRFPHNFDVLYAGEGAAPADPASAEPSLMQTLLENQKACLALSPPAAPQFNWQLDILAGKVTNISHDLTELERATALKNSWEEQSAGRTERAAAALAYYQECRRLKEEAGRGASSEGFEESKQSTASSSHVPIPLTPTMVESLGVALNTAAGPETEEVTARYSLVHKLPKYVERVEILPDSAVVEGTDLNQTDAQCMLIRPTTAHDLLNGENEVHPLAAEMRAQEKLMAEQKFTEISQKFIDFNIKLREGTKAHLKTLVESAYTDSLEMSKLWPAREEYRLEAEEKNDALNYLLNRSKEAIQKAKDIENGVDDPKAKKGAKKK